MSSRSRRSSHIFSEGDWLVRKITPSSPSAVLKMPRKPLDPVEARKVSQLCAKLVAGPQSLSAQNAAVKLAKQLAICPAAAAEVRRAGGVRRMQARPPRPARRARAISRHFAPSLPPIVRCVATLPLLLVPGNCGVRQGWRWGARPALRARRGADRAQADGRVHHAAGGRHSSPQKTALGPSTPAASPSPAPSCWAGHERRGRGGVRRGLPPSASPHGRAHRCTRSRPSGRRGGRPTL